MPFEYERLRPTTSVTARDADLGAGCSGLSAGSGGQAASYEVGGLDDAGFDDDEAVDEGLGGGFAVGIGAVGDDVLEFGA